MGWEERITITPGVRGGKPCIGGTPITVYDILEYWTCPGFVDTEVMGHRTGAPKG